MTREPTDQTRKVDIVVEVVFAEAERVQRLRLELPVGTQARDAVLLAEKNGLTVNGVNAKTAALGVYSERVADDYPLQDGDRLEVYRPLQQDPMELRRKRAKQSAVRR